MGMSEREQRQLMQRLAKLEKTVDQLMQPKSTARVMMSSVRLYRFTLNASLASGTADADILEMDGTDTGIDATVRDPAGIFATLVTVGDDGLCLYQDGKYWVIQANCPA